jgi:hypothetical protein
LDEGDERMISMLLITVALWVVSACLLSLVLAAGMRRVGG